MNNLTTKEKAILLVSKYYNLESEGDKGGWMTLNDSKQCAILVVDEILIEIRKIYDIYTEINIINIYQYWQKVKQEIEKL